MKHVKPSEIISLLRQQTRGGEMGQCFTCCLDFFSSSGLLPSLNSESSPWLTGRVDSRLWNTKGLRLDMYYSSAVSNIGVYANRPFRLRYKSRKKDCKCLHTSTSEDSMRGTWQELKGLSWACRGSRNASSLCVSNDVALRAAVNTSTCADAHKQNDAQKVRCV